MARMGYSRRWKYCEPFLPMRIMSHSIPWSLSSLNRASAFLIMKELYPPHRPRSPVMHTSVTLFTSRTVKSGRSAASPPKRSMSPPKTLWSVSEKGRVARTESWARRTFAAATSFMADVIFLVLFTVEMRSRMALALPSMTMVARRVRWAETGAAGLVLKAWTVARAETAMKRSFMVMVGVVRVIILILDNGHGRRKKNRCAC
mmetsp:Transcript_20959/g.50492  ORF Transcript_20959/g.50492 Transcript_20959/m.50492 type:complete len:203 (-) Transcript_20959:163-771(-)